MFSHLILIKNNYGCQVYKYPLYLQYRMVYKRKYRGKRSKPYNKKRISFGTRRSRLVRTIKSVVKRTAESKRKDYQWSKTELYHNVIQGGFLLNYGSGTAGAAACMPLQGTKDSERIGDEILLSGFKLRMLLGQKADRPNVTFRYWVLSVPKGYPYSYSTWFDATTNNVLLDSVNKDCCKILSSGTWRPNEAGLNNAGGDEYTFVKQLWIPYRKRISFAPHATTAHQDNDIHFLIAPYDAYGSLSTDNIAYIQIVSTMYYRDP